MTSPADGPNRPQIRDDLSVLEGYHSPQVDVEVRLNTNESAEPPPLGFADAVAHAVRTIDWHRYPDRAALDLRRAIGALHQVGPDQVFCANGSNEVLQTILLTFAGPGRRVLTFEPTYALHSHLGAISGSTVVSAERRDDFVLDPDHAVATVRSVEPSVVFLCSPNNPTGLVEPESTVRAVLDATEEVGGLLVLDEAYAEFSSWSGLSLIDDDRSLAVSRTYSKTWAMAAARLGYLIAPDWLIAELEKVVLPYHLDALKQAAGLAALDFLDDMGRRVSAVVEERGRISTTLLDLGCDVWPSGANFILFRPPGARDNPAIGGAVWEQLLDHSVLVRNTASWDRLGGCLRVTVGQPEENSRFLEALGAVLPATSSATLPTTLPTTEGQR